jgi:hypothetical protein
MNTKHYLDKVAEFHSAMLYRQPEPERPDLDKDTCELRVRLIQEEWDELLTAITKDDAVGQLDALCDLQYVIGGAALALGFRSHHQASVALAGTSDDGFRGFPLWLLQFATHLFRGNIPGSIIALAMLECHLTGIVKSLGFSGVVIEGFRRTHIRNMAKKWTREQVESCQDQGFRFVLHPEGHYIAYRPDGKISKYPGFVPPDLTDLVEKALACPQ